MNECNESEEVTMPPRDEDADDYQRWSGGFASSSGVNKKPFVIDDENKADWYLGKVAGMDAEMERIATRAGILLERLGKRKEQFKARFEPQLVEFARQQIERTGSKERTLRLLQGDVCFRRQSSKLRVTNLEAALEYARKNPELGLLRTTTSEVLDAKSYVALSQANQLPGVELVGGIDTYKVKITGSPFNDESDEEGAE